MIAERLPELASMSRDEKWQVYQELEQELSAGSDATEDPQLHESMTVEAVKELLDARAAQYRDNPDSARPWQEVRERLNERFETWKTTRQSA